MRDPLAPTVFTRQSLFLHAHLLENQPWFCARDLGRLMGWYLDERTTRKLDEDQRRTATLLLTGRNADNQRIRRVRAAGLSLHTGESPVTQLAHSRSGSDIARRASATNGRKAAVEHAGLAGDVFELAALAG